MSIIVTTKNYRGLKNGSYDLGKTLLLGNNGNGKSSIASIVDLLINGKIEKSDITYGCTDCAVNYALDSDDTGYLHVVLCYTEIDSNGQQKTQWFWDARAQPRKNIEANLERMYNINVHASKYSCGNFLHADTADKLAAFLVGAVAPTVSREAIESQMDAATKEEFAKISTLQNFGLDDFKAVVKQCDVTKKALKQNMLNLAPQNPQTADIDAVDKQIADLRVIEAQKKNMASVLAEYDKSVKNYESYKSQIDNLTKVIAENKATPANEFSINGTKQAIADAETNLHKATAEIGLIEKDIVKHQNMLDKLNTTQCPLCDQLECKTDKKPLIAIFEADIERLNTAKAKAEADVTSLNTEITDLRKEYAELVANRDAFVKKQADMKHLAELKQNAPAQPIQPKIDQMADEDISSKIQQLVQLRENAMRYSEYLKEFKKQADIKTEYDIVHTISKMFDLKGPLYQQLVNGCIATINQTVNAWSKISALGQISFGLDADGVLEVKVGNLDYDQLSTGQQLLVNFAVLHAINTFTNSKILSIDNVDDLDENNQKILAECVETVKPHYIILTVCKIEDKDEIFSKILTPIQL